MRMQSLMGWLACAAVVTGCGGPSAGTEPGPNHAAAGSVAHEYTSLAAVSRDSTGVVIGTVDGEQKVLPAADEEGTTNIPATLSTIRVEQVISGKSPGTTFVLRQLGSPETPVEDVPVLVPGQKYVLFVQPFYFHPGQSTGQWTTTAVNATYMVGADGSLKAVNPDSQLPDRSTLSALETAVRK